MHGPERIGEGKWRFNVWAPLHEKMTLHIVQPGERKIEMVKDRDGYFSVECDNISAGVAYFFQIDGKTDLPDPASHFQPGGIHKHSAVVDHSKFKWTDELWRGIPLSDLVISEI